MTDSNELIDAGINPDSLTKEQIQQLMDAGIAPDRITLLQKRMRKDVRPQLQGHMVGDRYIAPNPLQQALDAYQGYRNNQANEDMERQQDVALQSIPNARAVYAGAMDDPNMQAKMAAALRRQTDSNINMDLSQLLRMQQ